MACFVVMACFVAMALLCEDRDGDHWEQDVFFPAWCVVDLESLQL